MADFVCSIPDEQLPLMYVAVATVNNYQATVEDGEGNVVANPESLADFVRRIIVTKMQSDINEDVRAYESMQAAPDVSEPPITII